jgi:excisionase family DNA binding protein
MAGVREKLLTASDLAALCEVDLKTIHNWVDRGKIAHFRTPGRHLRFRAADVAEFLRAWGYSVPRELARESARTAMIIGSKDTAAHVTRAIGDALPVRHAGHPYDALVYAGADPADVYLVDLKEVARDADADVVLEALHRASPQASFVVLADETTTVPAFATRISRNDAGALKALLVPVEEAGLTRVALKPSEAAAPSLAEETPPGVAAGGKTR